MRFLLPFLLLFTTNVFSQQQNRCGTDEYNKDKSFNRSVTTVSDDEVDLDTKYRINVVFHIVYNDSIDPGMNLNDSDIEYLLECLNRDFNLLNTDTSTLTDTLKQLPGNMNIEFVLATEDPEGNPTNGITRTETSVKHFHYINDPVKYDSLGGKNAWDTRRYLNVWSCNTNIKRMKVCCNGRG